MDLIKGLVSLITTIIVIVTPQKTYTEGLVGQPASFLPNEAITENDKTVSKLIFRSLFTYDDEGNIKQDLADSYDISDDGLSYTIYLKKGQRWSNGVEITADDLLYSAFTSPSLKEIATDKIDKYTIRYTLPNKFSPFINVLTVGIVPSIPKNDSIHPISSGPYKVVRIKREGPLIREITLQKMDDDYNLNRISFRYYETEKQIITAARLGEVDGFVSMNDIDLPNFNKNINYQRGIYYSLIFNVKNSKLNDVNVRKKLLAATPFEEIAKDKGVLANGPISESSFTRADLNFHSYNAALKDDLKLKVILTLPDTKEHLQTGETIKEAWKNLGVEVILNPVRREDIEDVVVPARDFEILLYGQEVSRDPDRYSLWHSARIASPGLNISGFENIRQDRSLEEGRNAVKPEDRKRHYNIFQEVMHENVPALFLYHPVLKYYTLKQVKVVQESKMYYSHDRFLDIKDWSFN